LRKEEERVDWSKVNNVKRGGRKRGG